MRWSSMTRWFARRSNDHFAAEVASHLEMEVRTALRALRRTPTFTISTVAILALSIGAATAIFTVYKIVLIDRLPVTAADQLAIMHTLDRKGTHLDVPYAYLDVSSPVTAQSSSASPASRTPARNPST